MLFDLFGYYIILYNNSFDVENMNLFVIIAQGAKELPKIYIWALLKETWAALKLATSSRKPNDLFVAEFLLTERAPSSRKTYKHWMEASYA